MKDGKHAILGNDPKFWPSGTDTFGAPGGATSTSQFATTQRAHAEAATKAEERDKVNSYIQREKAKRQEADLQREVAVLQKQQEQRLQQIEYLQSTYKLK